MIEVDARADPPALVVDLDGTLIATDTLWEGILSFIRSSPLRSYRLLGWLFGGKAACKRHVASAAPLNASKLPYRPEFVQWLHEERSSGRRLILATAADEILATDVARHLALFDRVIASDGIANRRGDAKLDLILAMLGTQPFEYAADSLADLPVWEYCGSAVVVAPRPGVLRQLARRKISIRKAFSSRRASLGTWLSAIRAYQWIKNVLIFIPVVTSHNVGNPEVVMKGGLGFLCFSFAASAAYILNDLLDLEADRQHLTKRNRAFATGSLSIPAGLAGSLILLLASILIACLLSQLAAMVVAGYFVASVLYSILLKQMLVLDVISLAFFYTLRVNFGGLVTGIEISIWLLAFSIFSFFSLAAAKRINDLALVEHEGTGLARRAYRTADRAPLLAQASATGNISVLVLILYVVSPQVATLYRHPTVLLLLCPLLMYWFNRLAALANRGALHADPIVFAARDRSSQAVLAAALILVALAL